MARIPPPPLPPPAVPPDQVRPVPEPPLEPVERILAECMAGVEGNLSERVASACSRFPAHAEELRSRLRILAEVGFLDETQGGPPVSIPEHLGGFRLIRRIGSGGMGVVYLAHEEALDRTVALKLIRPEHLYFSESLERFQREVKTIAGLRHPGIVPVFSVGEAQGIPYLAMECVAGINLQEAIARLQGRRPERLTGRDLAQVLAEAVPQGEAPAGADADARFGRTWQEVCLRLSLQVADALAHVHAHGILHRDLKPSNVMVTPGGRVMLVDFGLASTQGAGRLTRSGSQAGSLPYMSPEQMRGSASRLDVRTDVYSLGVTLYELLSLVCPYLGTDTEETRRRVIEGRSASLREHNRAVTWDAETVCLKAMDRDPARRYATAADLARDLRNVLEFRPIAARRPGAMLRLKRLAQRRPAFAVAAACGALVLLGAPTGWAILEHRATLRVETQRQRADDERGKAEAARAQEEAARKEAQAHLDRFLQLADAVTLRDLVTEADTLWPEISEKAEAMLDWLRRARELARRRPGLEQALEAIKARASVMTEVEREEAWRRHPKALDLARRRERRAQAEEQIAQLRAKGREALNDEDRSRGRALRAEVERLAAAIQALEGEIQATPRFAATGDQFLFDTLERLVRELRAFESPDTGTIVSMERRHTWAATLRERTVLAEKVAWDQASASVASETECPQYAGLRLAPQVGLVPLGRDKASGLWEFWHPRTGARPEQDETGRYVVGNETGLVFVLIPGGSFWMGAQRQDRDGRNYDPQAERDESPVHELALAPFFLAKYEMTQGQYERFTGSNPSWYKPGWRWGGLSMTLRHPVEYLSFEDCAEALRRLGLLLPTEAQWEYACRAGSTAVWHTGDTVESLHGFANLADEGSKESSATGWRFEPGFVDGHAVHAPVGTLSPNAFGLFDMHGNVWEWCADEYGDFTMPVRPGDGARPGREAGFRVCRGGSFHDLAFVARSAFRNRADASYRASPLGCRAALGIRP